MCYREILAHSGQFFTFSCDKVGTTAQLDGKCLLASIDIYCQCGLLAKGPLHQRSPILSSSLNVQLTDALRKYVDERASDKDVYATPS